MKNFKQQRMHNASDTKAIQMRASYMSTPIVPEKISGKMHCVEMKTNMTTNKVYKII